MSDEFCEKHPSTRLQIGKGKNKNRFVFCPDCKAAKTGSKSEPAAAGEKKNVERREQRQSGGPGTGGGNVPWYDRPIL